MDSIGTTAAQDGTAGDCLRAEESLREFVAKQQAIIRATNIGLVILDRAGLVSDANDEYVKLSGHSTLQEILGRPVTDWTAMYDMQKNAEAVKCCFANGVVHNLEIDYLHKDGRVVPVEINAGIWKSGDREEIVSWCRDNRARRNDQLALRESEAKFRSMMEAMDDVVYICSRNYRVEYMNPAMIRRTGRDATGELCFQALHERTEACPWCVMDRVMKGERVKWDVTSPKDDHTFSVSNTPLRHADGRISKMAVIRDVTDLKKADEERRKLEMQMLHTQKLESLGVLAGGIAHDFNNLLVAILGNIDFALSDLPPDSPVKNDLKSAEDAAHRAADLCRQMLAYSGKSRFVVEALDLNFLVREMTGMLKMSISKRSHLVCSLAGDLPPIEADSTQVRQIVMNLVINASESSDKGGRNDILITTGVKSCDRAYLSSSISGDDQPEGLYVFVEVSDTGCGIAPEKISRIFDPFFTTKITGRGLGLAAVLGIVRSHKGLIKVDSEVGKGTRFRVLFPSLQRVVEAVSPAGICDDGKWRGEGTVLLVDDEAMILAVGKSMLNRTGFDVLTAWTGTEAVESFKANHEKIVCVIMDVTMPEMDGAAALRAIKAVRSDIPVIMTSGNGERDEEDLKGEDIAAFMLKPYQLAVLKRTLRRILGHRLV